MNLRQCLELADKNARTLVKETQEYLDTPAPLQRPGHMRQILSLEQRNLGLIREIQARLENGESLLGEQA